MRFHIVLAVCVSLLNVSQCFAGSATFDGGSFAVNWTYNSSTDKIKFQVEAKTTGWVGVGFADSPNTAAMNNYDVAVGGVRNNAGYLNDFHTEGTARPPMDKQQDYNLTGWKQTGNKTTLEFERKRDTGDSNDTQFSANNGSAHCVWAYSSGSAADNSSSFSKHSRRGISDKKLEIVPQDPSASVPASASVNGRGTLVNVFFAVILYFLRFNV